MKNKEQGRFLDRIAWILFVASIALAIFTCGILVGKYKVFPYHVLSYARKGAAEIGKHLLFAGLFEEWLYIKSTHYILLDERFPRILNTADSYKGLNLVTRVSEKLTLSAEIIDMEGNVLHRWAVDWYQLWPEPEHLPKDIIPRSRPGTHIHGAVIMPNGDVVFSFEHLGTIRLDREGEVVWRLPYRTHHSVHLHDDGNLWICGQRRKFEADPDFPDREPPFDEYTIVEVSPEGHILQEWSIPEILKKNGKQGLLSLWFKPQDTQANKLDDRLHLNDVEPFPSAFKEGFFKKGDILVSLRNINAVFVFNRESEKIKYLTVGDFIHQHDPDFMDGNRFSVFDNKTVSEDGGFHSRIVIVSVAENSMDVYFEEDEDASFFTGIMGKHQWLPNGNLLITESMKGRAFEITPEGEIVWQYVNYVKDDIVGILEEVQRLPLNYESLWTSEESN